jgi:hypothetical protein
VGKAATPDNADMFNAARIAAQPASFRQTSFRQEKREHLVTLWKSTKEQVRLYEENS